MFVVDQRCVVLVFNAGCVELTGWEPADVIGQTCSYSTVASLDSVASLTSAICPPGAVFDGRTLLVPVNLRHRDGTLLERTIHFVPLFSSAEDRRILGIISDRLPEYESRLEQTRFDLSKLSAELSAEYNLDRLIAVMPSTRKLAEQINLVRGSRAAVQLIGEAGTGKEFLARIIHVSRFAQGTRKPLRFVTLPCRDMAYDVLQSSLSQLMDDIQNEAGTGTVFLREVEHLPRDLQNKVMEAMAVRSDLRWCSSAVGDLSEMAEREFSRELAMKLTTVVMAVPALRERRDEIRMIAHSILDDCNRVQRRQVEGFLPEVEEQFEQYAWPGNVGELSRVVEKSWSRCSGTHISIEDLPFEFFAGQQSDTMDPELSTLSLTEKLEQVERDYIHAALDQAEGNKMRAARLLGIPRAKLYRRLDALNLDDDEIDEDIEIEESS